MGYDDKHFIGRERAVREIVQGVLADPPTSFSLVGSRLSGKSKLLAWLISDDGPLIASEYESWRPYVHRDGSRVLPMRIDCSIPAAREDFLAFLHGEVANALQKDAGLNLRTKGDGGAFTPVQTLAMMRDVADQGYRAVLLLDNFDRVFSALPQDTVNELRPLTFQTALVVASEQPLHDLDKGLAASPLFNIMTQVFVGLVEEDTARKWVEEQLEPTPGLLPAVDSLLEMTGNHPYLLRQVGDIIVEVKEMLPAGVDVGVEHLPLINLRMAEHGRVLFETFWRRIQAPPQRVKPPVLLSLLQRLVRHPITLANATREETSTLNWLINQGMVVYASKGGSVGYKLFSPLFADSLAERFAPPVPEAHNGNGVSYGAAESVYSPFEPAYVGGLTRIESMLLAYLQAHSRQVISPEQLLADVWKRPDATPRRVQEAIRRLRLELEVAEPPIGVIENDRGRGYRFVPAAR